MDQRIPPGVGISEAERGASRSQARSTDFTGGVRDWEGPTVHSEQHRDQRITPGERDLRNRAQNQQVARQINGFHRRSLVLRGFHGAPWAAHGSTDFTRGSGFATESAESADQLISLKVSGSEADPAGAQMLIFLVFYKLF